MMDFYYMVGMWLCHIPTLHHIDIFPPSGNMTGGNMLVGHDDDDLGYFDHLACIWVKSKVTVGGNREVSMGRRELEACGTQDLNPPGQERKVAIVEMMGLAAKMEITRWATQVSVTFQPLTSASQPATPEPPGYIRTSSPVAKLMLMFTSPREAEGATSLPLPKVNPSLEMFSRETERPSLMEKTELLKVIRRIRASIRRIRSGESCHEHCRHLPQLCVWLHCQSWLTRPQDNLTVSKISVWFVPRWSSMLRKQIFLQTNAQM